MENEPALQAMGVSAREAEVLAGVAEHLTNAEIAEQLVISVRTVESHVSSLLRKLGVGDRRALAGLAVAVTGGVAPSRSPRPAAPLPAPLTPFIGRAAERAGLAAALAEHRLVTALGPGGIGKTRLALAVAGELAAGTSGRAASSSPAARSGLAARTSWRRWAPLRWHDSVGDGNHGN